MKLFAQITKVDEAKRLVYGRAVQEVPDRSGEIFDYASSRPHFEDWSKGFSDQTDGKSLGNIRAMHGKVAAGKVTAIEYNDGDKAIDIAAKIVDDAEWSKVIEGVYTGFSIGGSYVGEKKTEKVDGKDLVRYTAKPSEISIVDSPCIPTAKFFDIVKADGAVAKIEFKAATPEANSDAGTSPPAASGEAAPKEPELAKSGEATPPADAKPAATTEPLVVKGEDADVEAFAKALNDSGLTMTDAIEALGVLVTKRADAAKTPEPAAPPTIEVMVEAFGKLDDAAKTAFVDTLRKALPSNDVHEALEAALGAGLMRKRLDDPELSIVDLVKIAEAELTDEERKPLKTLDDVRKAIVDKMSMAHKDKAQAIHDHASDMGATCGGEKADTGGSLQKLEQTISDMKKELDTIRAMPVPHVQLRVVSKEQDGGAGTGDKRGTEWTTRVPFDKQHKFADNSIDWMGTAGDDELFKQYGTA